MKDFSCEYVISKFPTSIYVVKIDLNTEEIVEMKFLHHIPYSKYSTKSLEDPSFLKNLIPPEDWKKIKKKFAELLEKESISFVYKIKAKDNRYIFLNTKFAVLQREGNYVYVVGYSEEVSEKEELKEITNNLFSFKDIGILIYQEKVVFVNDYVKEHFGLKEGDDLFEMLSYDSKLIELMKRRLKGEQFQMYHPSYELHLNGKRIYADIFANTILYKGRYSGFVILLDKSAIIKRDIFLEILNRVYAKHLNCKNEESFLHHVVDVINQHGFSVEIEVGGKVFGKLENKTSLYVYEDNEFRICIGSKYVDDFVDVGDLILELMIVIKHSYHHIIKNKNLVLLKNSFDESLQAVVITDEFLNVLYANKVFRELVKRDVKNLNEFFENIELKDKPFEQVIIGNAKDKKVFLKVKIIPIEYGKKYYVFQGIELSDNYSVIDSLTNLLNRRGFLQKHSINYKKAVVVVDIYEYKSIVEARGIEDAENTLIALAKFLRDDVGIEELGRVGGDEFAFLVEFESIDELEEFVKNLIKEINVKLKINVNVGVAIADEGLNNLEVLLEKAYIALKRAVNLGINRYEIYNDTLALEKRRFYVVQEIIKDAIINDNFIFHFQPYVDKNRRIVGVESLIRIKRDDKIIYPGEFIDIAEKSGLISEIEDITFPKIIEYAKELNINVSYNLSAYSFRKNTFYKNIPKVDNLIIEITERILSDMDLAKDRIDKLKKHNIKISIDDFGTGYSNFMSLKELDFDILKIDMSFVRQIENSKKDRAIVKSIIDFAKTVGLITIAEGVENKTQAEMLIKMGCDYLQGFYFYKPMEFDELKKLLGGENE